jgi:glycosyltransferase involved in cell wall biosynthesis
MRIAILSTCATATPPRAYGGTELVLAELANALCALGHDVTVFATGDSAPAGRLRYHFRAPVWPPNDLAELRHAAFAWREIAEEGFDVVHVNHATALPSTLSYATPVVCTLHHERGAGLVEFYCDFPGVDYVAISERQRQLSPEIPIRHVVHHGLDPASYPAGDGRGDYVAYLGRFAADKGTNVAIDAALAAGVKLRMGGAVHPDSRDFFAREIEPRLFASRGCIECLGELSHRPKLALLQHARALVFPIMWEEPFGLVMIEAMLVGTPVIAFPRGSAPEVVDEGVTGFLVGSQAELTDAIRRVGTIDRARCRARAAERWSHLRMAADYLRVYEDAVSRPRPAHGRLDPLRGRRFHGARADAAG